MYFIVFSKARKKTLILFLTICFWALMYFAAGLAMKNSFSFTISMGNCAFSCPYSFTVTEVYANDISKVESSIPVFLPAPRSLAQLEEENFNISFKYPSSFVVDEKMIFGNEILYHIGFHDSQGSSRGFAQVWKLSISLKDFLNQSKSTSQLNYLSFEEREFKDRDRVWHIWDYTVVSGNGAEYRGLEGFFSKNNIMYRLSYFVPAGEWDESHSEIFMNMLKSFEFS